MNPRKKQLYLISIPICLLLTINQPLTPYTVKHQKRQLQQETHTAKKTWVDIFDMARNNVVQVFAFGTNYDWTIPFRQGDDFEKRGTGFIASKDGDIYTNFHVISNADAIYIQHPLAWKERFEVEFIGGSPEFDLAHLRLKPEAKDHLEQMLSNQTISYLDLADSDKLHQGEKVMLVGYPLGEEYIKHAIGSISGQETTPWGDCFTTTAPSYQGNSGSPVLDKNGKVIGILVGGVGESEQSSSINYIIPINRLKVHLSDFNNGAIVHQSYLGIQYTSTTVKTLQYLGCPTTNGVYITNVTEGSLGYAAGLRAGDIITQINNYEIDRFGYVNVPWSTYRIRILDALARIKNGSTITFSTYRGGKQLQCSTQKKIEQPFKIKKYFLPFEKQPTYDVFGGMVIMELTMNHIDIIISILSRWINFDVSWARYISFFDENYKTKPHLLITHVFAETELAQSNIFSFPDGFIYKVNDQEVYTLDDFYNAVSNNTKTGYLVIETIWKTKAALDLNEVLQQEPILAEKYHYNISPLVDLLNKQKEAGIGSQSPNTIQIA